MWTVIFTAAAILMVGLVVDGGIHLRAARRADAVAQEAARAGAQSVARPTGNGGLVMDPAGASRAARTYLSSARETGSVRVRSGRRLEVTVTVRARTGILCLIGICSVSSTGTANADLVYGTTQRE